MRYPHLFSRTTLFCISLVSILYFLAMEYLIRKFVIVYDYDYQRSILFKNSNKENTIWGDSATMTGINFLRDFVNFSSGSQSYHEIEMKIKHYYSDKSKNGKVILQLALNGFSPYRDRKPSDSTRELYLANESEINFLIFKNYFRKRSYDYLKNFFRNKFTIQINSKDKYNSDGSVTYMDFYNPIQESSIPKTLYKALDLSSPAKNFESSKNYESLLQIIAFLKKERMEICLISTPLHDDYFRYYYEKDKFNDINNFYNSLAEKNKLKYINYTINDYPDNFFRDTTHLNKLGSKAFTKAIDKECFDK